MPLGPAVPVLRSFNEDEARDFYIRYLGFEVLFEHRFEPGLPLYLGLRREGCELHVSEHHGDATPGARLRIETGDIRALAAELAGRGHKRLRPGLCDTPWGDVELTVTDPFGNRLTFWQTGKA